jgi:uncharacterized OB-fold protein
MNESLKESKVFIPGSKKNVVPFMRDVFTIPTNSRQKPNLIGSICPECEEYFFPKTGQKATCDNPFCPRSTKETLLSGKGRILSATVTRSPVEGEDERASAVIMLEEGIKINSPLLGWEGYQYLLVPGTLVELVLQEMGETDDGNVVVGYAFRLVTGRKKPQIPTDEKEEKESAPALKKPAATEPPIEAKPKPLKSEAKSKQLKKPAKKVVKKKAAKKKTTKKSLKKKTIKAPSKKKPVKKKVDSKKRPKKAIRGKKKKVVEKKAKKKTAGKINKKVAKKKTLKKKSPSNKSARKKITRRPKAKKR